MTVSGGSGWFRAMLPLEVSDSDGMKWNTDRAMTCNGFAADKNVSIIEECETSQLQ